MGGTQQLGGGVVVECLGQRMVLAREVAGNIGTVLGASSHPHSSMRTKNIRRVPSRCAAVAVLTRGLFCPGLAASQGL